jgi:beta-lactamase superfamily II metal-dependent hydrolase
MDRKRNLRFEMLPAREGDCILISYPDGNRTARILFDGGRKGTATALLRRLRSERNASIDLLVVTHVDRDHIEGILELLRSAECPRIGEIWFNGYRQLEEALGLRGAAQGEALSVLIRERSIPHNSAFGGKPVISGLSKSAELPGGMVVEVLSPDVGKLRKLERQWILECRRAGLLPGGGDLRQRGGYKERRTVKLDIDRLAAAPFDSDDAAANGSSIAVLLEWRGRRILMAADAHEDLILRSLKRIRPRREKMHLDLLKVSHHASARNTSSDLFDQVICNEFAVSTNGAVHGHPDAVTLARIVKASPHSTIHCNYTSTRIRPWLVPTLKAKHPYEVKTGIEGYLALELTPLK